MMTKKDYLRVAEAMHTGYEDATKDNQSWYAGRQTQRIYLSVVRDVATAFAASDPKFMANDFLTAAGIAGLLVKS